MTTITVTPVDGALRVCIDGTCHDKPMTCLGMRRLAIRLLVTADESENDLAAMAKAEARESARAEEDVDEVTHIEVDASTIVIDRPVREWLEFAAAMHAYEVETPGQLIAALAELQCWRAAVESGREGE